MDNAHRLIWDLIPWVVNGSASEADCRTVDAHRQSCADCQTEFVFQQQLAGGMAGTAGAGDAPDAGQALLRFWADEAAIPPFAVNDIKPRWQRALIAAALLQTVGLAAALAYIWQGGRTADYQTLSQPAATAGLGPVSIRLVPAPGMQLGELRALLAHSDLQLVQASADAGHLGLALAPGARFSTAQAVQRLQAEPGVLLAEPTP